MSEASSIATVLAFVFTAITFWFLFCKNKKSQQFTIANDFSKSLREIEDKVLAVREGDEKEKRYRYLQYLNAWEWFAVLVKHNQITEASIHEHFRSSLLRFHNSVFKKYPDLKDNEEFPEFRRLYDKWK